MIFLSQPLLFISLMALTIILGFVAEVSASLKMRRKLISFYFSLLCIMALSFFSNAISLLEFDSLKLYLESEYNLLINFSFKNVILFLLLIFLTLWESYSLKSKKKKPNYFWAIALTYIALFADSYLILICCFESLAWIFFFEHNESRELGRVVHIGHLALGSIFTILVFTETMNYGYGILSNSESIEQLLNSTDLGQVWKWIVVTLVFVRSFSTLSFLKYEKTNKIYLLPYFLFVGLILKPFSNNVEVGLTSLNLCMAMIAYLLAIMASKDFGEKIINSLHAPFLLGLGAFLRNIIMYDFFILTVTWIFLIYYLYLNIKQSAYKKMCVLLLSLTPPSPLFALIIKYLESPAIESVWIQCMLFLLGLNSIHQMAINFSTNNNLVNNQSSENVI